MEKLTIGFIGYGNMAQAIAKGLVDSGKVEGKQLVVCAKNYEKCCANAEKIGAQPMEDAREVVEQSDFVVIAVKPYLVEEVVAPLKEQLYHKVVISIAAGCDYHYYERILLSGTHHMSTIPNTPVAVGEGIWVCEEKHSLSDEEMMTFEEVFGAIGIIERVESKNLSIAGTMSGCTPAFTAMYMEALADAGVKHGLTRACAYRLAAQMLAGTGKLYLDHEQHPGMMKDAVCSPNGTTIKGVAALEKNGFRGVVIEAIDVIEDTTK